MPRTVALAQITTNLSECLGHGIARASASPVSMRNERDMLGPSLRYISSTRHARVAPPQVIPSVIRGGSRRAIKSTHGNLARMLSPEISWRRCRPTSHLHEDLTREAGITRGAHHEGGDPLRLRVRTDIRDRCPLCAAADDVDGRRRGSAGFRVSCTAVTFFRFGHCGGQVPRRHRDASLRGQEGPLRDPGLHACRSSCGRSSPDRFPLRPLTSFR